MSDKSLIIKGIKQASLFYAFRTSRKSSRNYFGFAPNYIKYILLIINYIREFSW